jgi:transcriptional regulator with XRE-family HTH domain
MNGRTLVREARRRAGLTQAELADRVNTTQSAIARLEAGATSPSLARIAQLIGACGLTLSVGVTDVDDDEWRRAQRNLALTPDQRVRNMLAAEEFVRAGRAGRSGRTSGRHGGGRRAGG